MIDLIDEIPLLKSAIINKQKEANFEQKTNKKILNPNMDVFSPKKIA